MRTILIMCITACVVWMIWLALVIDGRALPFDDKPWVGANEIYVDEGESLASAIAAASDGMVIYLLPGAHPDSNITVTKAVFIVGKGPLRSVRMTASDTLFILGSGSRGLSFENLMIDCGGTGSWIRPGAINYTMSDCHIKAKAWNVGDNVSYFERCQLEIGTYAGMTIGGTTAASSDTAWFVDCQWGYPLFVEPVWQYPLSTGTSAQNGVKIVDNAFFHMRYSRSYTDSTAIDVAANSGFGGSYFGIHYNSGDGPTFTNNATTGASTGGSFLWSAIQNNDATNGTVQLGGAGTAILVDNFIINKAATTAPTYKSTSSVGSAIFGGHFTSSSSGGASTITAAAVDYPMHGWVDVVSAPSPFFLSGALKWVDPDGPTVRSIISTIVAGGDTMSTVNADSVLFDGTRDRGAQ